MTINVEDIEKLFSQNKFDDISNILLPLVNHPEKTNIPLWNIFYLIGQSYRFKEDLHNAVVYLGKSVDELEDPLKQTIDAKKKYASVYHALGIAHQLLGNYDESIKASSTAIDLDDEQPSHWNSFAITQRLMKQYDKSEKNNESALKIYFRNIVDKFNNSKNSIYYPFENLSNKVQLHVKYSMDAAMYLAVKNGFDTIAMPNGKLAEKFTNDKETRSLYWSEQISKEKNQKDFLIMPNYFNTIFKIISNDILYINLIGNKGTVLMLQNKKDHEKYLYESNLLKSFYEKPIKKN